jgi:hypothetical protein
MRGWARPPIRPLQEIRTHLDVRLQGNAENLARLARDWFYAARGGPCPLSGTWRNQTRSQRLVPLSVSTTVLNRFRPGRDRHPLVRHHDRLVQRPLCRSSPFFARCRYPGMKTFLASLVALVMLSPHTYAEPSTSSLLPSTPVPVRR